MNEPDMAGAGAAGGIIMIIYLAMIILMIAGCWKAYSKAGKPGWACIIPIYNILVWLEICGRPAWWIILVLFIPIVPAIIVSIDFAKSYGKGAGTGIGIFLLPFVFLPIIGFGSASFNPSDIRPFRLVKGMVANGIRCAGGVGNYAMDGVHVLDFLPLT